MKWNCLIFHRAKSFPVIPKEVLMSSMLHTKDHQNKPPRERLKKKKFLVRWFDQCLSIELTYFQPIPMFINQTEERWTIDKKENRCRKKK